MEYNHHKRLLRLINAYSRRMPISEPNYIKINEQMLVNAKLLMKAHIEFLKTAKASMKKEELEELSAKILEKHGIY